MKISSLVFLTLLISSFILLGSNWASGQATQIGVKIPDYSPTLLSPVKTDFSLYETVENDELNLQNRPINLRDVMVQISNPLSTDLYQAEELAFFCRLEVKMEKSANLPVKFRLGDVQYVDYLEGKFTPWRYGY